MLLLAALSTHPQAFTNAATLSAAVDGTSLLVNYSLITTQGWVTLFAADHPEQFGTSAQPVDIAPRAAHAHGPVPRAHDTRRAHEILQAPH